MRVFVLTTFHEEVLLKRVLVVYVFFFTGDCGKVQTRYTVYFGISVLIP